MKKIMQTRTGLLAAAITGLALLAGGASAQQVPGVTDKEIRLGTWMPLTGPIAGYGIPQLAGIQAALQAANDAGGIKGRKFSLIHEDNGFNPQRTVAAARKMVTRDEIFAFVVPNGTPQTFAALDYVLGEAKVPLINPYAGAIEWYNPPKENLYGLQVPLELQARMIGRLVAKEGNKKVIVAHLTLAGNERMAQHFAESAKRVNSSITIENIPIKLGTADLGPVALEIAAKKPDAVAIFLTQNETVGLLKELQQQRVKAATFVYASVVNNALVELAGSSAEGLKSASFIVPPTHDNLALRQYRTALAKVAPTEKPDYVSLDSYAMTLVFIEAMRRIDGPITRQALTKSLDGMKNFATGILPAVSYGPDRHLGTTSLHTVQVSGGKWVVTGDPVDAEKDW